MFGSKQYRHKHAHLIYLLPSIIYISIMAGFITVYRIYNIFIQTNNLPANLGIAFLMGNLFFCFSLMITNWYHLKEIRLLFINLSLFLPFISENVKRIPSLIYIILEELFWRGFLQMYLFNNILLIPLITGLFTLIHFQKFKKEKADITSIVEFFVYFLMLSYIFYITESIYAAITIHIIRNTYAEFWSFLKKLNSKTVLAQDL